MWQVAHILEILRSIDDDTERAEFLAQVLVEGLPMAGWMPRGPHGEAPPLRSIFLVQMGSLRAHISTPTTPHVYVHV